MGRFSYKASLRNRFVIVVVLMLMQLCMLVVGQTLVFNSTVKHLDSAVEFTSDEFVQLQILMGRMYQSIMAPNDYLVNDDTAEIEKYAYLSQEVTKTFGQLAKTMVAYPDEILLLNKARAEWDQANEKAEYILSIEKTVGKNQRVVAMKAMDQYAYQSMSFLQKLLYLSQDEILDELNEVERFSDFMMILIVGGIAVSALVILWLNVVLAKSIINPICCIMRDATKIGDGEYSSRLQWQRNDEIGDLAMAIDVMAEKLEKSHIELEALSCIDSLTGLSNRREYYRFFQKELDRAMRYGRNISLVIFDVDNFKKINDTYGHLVGDEVLHVLAQVMKGAIRTSDQIARYGGEEFVLTLPEVATDGAYILSERIRKMIELIDYKTPDGVSIKITVSAGIASFPDNGKMEKEIFLAADTALYEAKNNGRNCTVCA